MNVKTLIAWMFIALLATKTYGSDHFDLSSNSFTFTGKATTYYVYKENDQSPRAFILKNGVLTACDPSQLGQSAQTHRCQRYCLRLLKGLDFFCSLLD